jgi:tetratricopeptide (TPR) repeat protein/TolB-like protein
MAGLGSELVRRRFPQIVGGYLAGCWIAVEFADWMVNRFVLSPYIVDFVAVLLLLLVPSVALLAHFHGAPGRDRWTLAEKIGVPANLVIAGVVLVSMFGGKDLGAATTTVVVEDEEGTTIERVVPKSEFRRRIAVFPFDNETGDPELDWLQYGIFIGVAADLIQDLFVQTMADPFTRLREEGFAEGTAIPLPLKRQIAEERHQSHFLAGRISGSRDSLAVTASLHDALSGNVAGERTYAGGDLFTLIDSITVQLKRDLDIPGQQLETTQDLPVREIMTISDSAYRDFVAGIRALAVERDWQAAGEHLESAVARDSTFALAQLQLYGVSILGNRTERAFQALQAAMDHSYRLPERTQYGIKTEYYQSVRQDTERAMAVAEMRAELFPDDIEAHQIRVVYYGLQNEKQRQAAAIEQILELDPSQHQYLQQAGGVYQSMGDFETALDYYARYAEMYPDDSDSFLQLASLSRSLGRHEEAIQQVERSLLIEPENGAAIRQRARLDADLGRFEQAEEGYTEALDLARTGEQRAVALESLSEFYKYRGQVERALDFRVRSLAEQERVNPEFVVILWKIRSLDDWAAAGRGAEALDSLSALKARLSPPFDGQAVIGDIVLHVELENPDELEPAIDSLEAYVNRVQVEALRPLVVGARARLAEMREDCETALERDREMLELTPSAYTLHRHIGRCQRKLGRLDEAEASLREVLKIRPSHPRTHHELALVEEARGNTAQAIEHLQAALQAWANADAVFKPAAEARAKLAELEGS